MTFESVAPGATFAPISTTLRRSSRMINGGEGTFCRSTMSPTRMIEPLLARIGIAEMPERLSKSFCG